LIKITLFKVIKNDNFALYQLDKKRRKTVPITASGLRSLEGYSKMGKMQVKEFGKLDLYLRYMG